MNRVTPFHSRRYYYYDPAVVDRRRAAALGGAAFSPLSLAPFLFWLPEPQFLFEEEDGTGAITATEAVGYMADQGSGGDPAIQATAGARPTYQTSDGLHWLEGDGVDDFLLASSIGLSFPYYRISAWRITQGLEGPLWNPGTAAGGLFANTGLHAFVGGADLFPPDIPAAGEDFVVVEHYTDDGSRMAVDNGAYATGNAPSGFGADLKLFAEGSSGGSRFYGGGVFPGDITDPEIALLRTYLAAKQGRVL